MARMSLWNGDVGASVRDSSRMAAHSPPLAALIGQTTLSVVVRLAALFEFFEGGLELGEHKLAVFWDVGDDVLPICDGVGFVAEGGVAAS